MRKLIFIILILIFSAIYYYSTFSGEGSIVSDSITNIKKMIKNSTNSTENSNVAQNNDHAGALTASADESADQNLKESLHEMKPEELKKWVADEARTMNSANKETEDIQIKLQARSQTLLPQQLAVLKDLAIDSGLPINDRIFSAYLIILNQSKQSQESLFNVAKTEVPDLGPILPHSEAELKHTQELAIRYMQIDELFQRAKTDANALDKLKLLTQEAQSAQVRSYAEKKLKELK